MRSDRDFGFTDEQLMLRDAVRQFVRKEMLDPYARRCDHEQLAPLEVFDNSRLSDGAPPPRRGRHVHLNPGVLKTVLYWWMSQKDEVAHRQHGYLIENGRVVMHDRAEVLKSNPDIQEFYLGGSEGKDFRDIKHYRRRKRWLA